MHAKDIVERLKTSHIASHSVREDARRVTRTILFDISFSAGRYTMDTGCWHLAGQQEQSETTDGYLRVPVEKPTNESKFEPSLHNGGCLD